MDKYAVSRSAWDLIYLVRCALHGQRAAAERICEFDLEELYRQARFHSISSMAAVALEGRLSQEAMAPWQEDWVKALRKNILLDIECKALCAEMEKRGIWHMPLKGSIIKDLYPRMELRQMTDQDILFDTTRRDEMRRFMLDRGYSTDEELDNHHDVYTKKPIYNIELHHTLFEPTHGMCLDAYYQNVRSRLLPNAPGSFGCHFSDEDFYLYMLAHAYKHYFEFGMGLRTFTDVYVYISRKGKSLNWDYIRQESKVMGIGQFEPLCRSVAQKLFANEMPEELTGEEMELLEYCLHSGTFGTQDGHMTFALKQLQNGKKKLSFGTKVRYLLRRLFPDVEYMKKKSKMVKKHPWTLPFAWIVRLLRGAFQKREAAVQEFGKVMDREKV